MYNEKLKRQYINDNKDRNSHIEAQLIPIFNKIEYFEELYGIDCCQFSASNIIDFYKSLCVASYESIMVINSQLKLYTAYCMNRTLVEDGQNHYEELNGDVLLSCVNKALSDNKIVTRSKLLEILDDPIVQNPAEKCLILAMFEGICGKEMSELTQMKITDFNKNNLTVKVYPHTTENKEPRVVNVSEKLYKYAKEAVEETQYFPYIKECSASSNLGTKYMLSTDEKYKDWIFKPFQTCKGDDDNLTTLRKRLYMKLMRVKEFTGYDCFTKTALRDSGIIEYIRKEHHINKSEFIDIISSKDFINQYGDLQMAKVRFIKKYQKYLEDEWK